MANKVDPVDGLLIPDPRFVDADFLAPNDGTTLGSSYTQAVPRPGMSVPAQDGSRLAPRITGALEQGIGISCITAGNPSLDFGVEMGYKLSTESAEEVRGWNQPNALLGWDAPHWTTLSYPVFDAVTIPSTGEVILAAGVLVWIWSPVDWSWTSVTTIPTLVGGHSTTSIFCIPGTERIVVIVGTFTEGWYSDDKGQTWTEYTISPQGKDNPSFTLAQRTRTVYLESGVSCFVKDAAANTYHQLVSTNQGITFDFVETLTTLGTSLSMTECRGKIVVGYLNTAGYPTIKILGSAASSLSAATVYTIEAVNRLEISIVSDTAGVLYAYVSDKDIAVWVSYDIGQSWSSFRRGLSRAGAGGDYPSNFKTVHTSGMVLLLHNWVANFSAQTGSIGCIYCGGWSTLTFTSAVNNSREQHYRGGFGANTVSTSYSHTWLPLELPKDSGWTPTGVGTGTLVAPGAVQIVTTGNKRSYTRSLGANSTGCFLAELSVASGGSVALDRVGCRMLAANGTDDREVVLRVTTSSFALYDNNASAQIGSTVFVDLTSNMQFVVVLGTTVEVYYRRAGTTKWTTGITGTPTNNTGSPRSLAEVDWGHIGSSTATSSWKILAITTDLSFATATDSQSRGKPLTTDSIGIPDIGSSGERITRISVVGGPGVWGEDWTVTPRYDYPVTATISTSSPSPDRGWRSTSTAEQIITWDLKKRTALGNGIAALVKAANYRTAYVEYHDGTTWITAGTYDGAQGFTGMTYDLTGDSITPASGTTAGGRYIWENEFAGGHIITDTSGTPKARKIVSNTAGLWVGTSSTKRATFILEGIDGTEAATGTCHVVSPSGVLVVHHAASIMQRYWRYRIPASQVVAESYYTTGIITLAAVQPFGAESGWGQGQQYTGNVASSQDRYGTTYTEELGPVVGQWTMGFSPTLHTAIRQDADIDYRGINTGGPLATVGDTAYLLAGLMKKTRSGEIPVVGMAQIPLTTSTITDPSLYLYGRLLGPITIAIEVGTMGVSEVVRVDNITINELV